MKLIPDFTYKPTTRLIIAAFRLRKIVIILVSFFIIKILADNITQPWLESLGQSEDQLVQKQCGRGHGSLAASNGFSSQRVMPFESPPPEARECSSCGDLKSLNFFALDSDECRRCEALKQRRAAIAQAEQAMD